MFDEKVRCGSRPVSSNCQACMSPSNNLLCRFTIRGNETLLLLCASPIVRCRNQTFHFLGMWASLECAYVGPFNRALSIERVQTGFFNMSPSTGHRFLGNTLGCSWGTVSGRQEQFDVGRRHIWNIPLNARFAR